MKIESKKCATNDGIGCALELTSQIISGKWKMTIIYALLGGTKRYGELRRLVALSTPRMLTVQLRDLEKNGVLDRKVYAETPPKVEYSLTKRGAELKPVIEAIAKWGQGIQAVSSEPLKRK